jgi:hypothetical protein
VKTRVDERLMRELSAFELAFRCEACCAFDPDRSTCAYGYPTEPHRGPIAPDAEQVVFCKAFEVA